MDKNNLNSDYYSIGRVSLILDISDHTITRWYKWWESEEFIKPVDLVLPPYYFKDRRRTKFFKKSDVPVLRDFRNKLQTTHRGSMAEFNAAYQWGKRGDKILKNKDTSVKEVRKKIR